MFDKAQVVDNTANNASHAAHPLFSPDLFKGQSGENKVNHPDIIKNGQIDFDAHPAIACPSKPDAKHPDSDKSVQGPKGIDSNRSTEPKSDGPKSEGPKTEGPKWDEPRHNDPFEPKSKEPRYNDPMEPKSVEPKHELPPVPKIEEPKFIDPPFEPKNINPRFSPNQQIPLPGHIEILPFDPKHPERM